MKENPSEKQQISIKVEKAYIDAIDELQNELGVTSRNEVIKRIIHMTGKDPESVIAEYQKQSELNSSENSWTSFKNSNDEKKVEIVKENMDESVVSKKDIKKVIKENTDLSSSYSYQIAADIYEELHNPICNDIDNYWDSIVDSVVDDKKMMRNIEYYKSDIKRYKISTVVSDYDRFYNKKALDEKASEAISSYNIKTILKWLVDNKASKSTVNDVITTIRLQENSDFNDDEVKQMIDEEINKVK